MVVTNLNGGPRIRLGLEVINNLLKELSNPHLKLPLVHIGGTNGKGSICAHIEQILRHSNYRVARFTSPYLRKPSDSITIDGKPMDDQDFLKTLKLVESVSNENGLKPTGFEVLTAIAFQTFSNRVDDLDLAVVEVGMGGESDCTNVCGSDNTLVSCLTPIGLDHQSFLGSTIEEITNVKAGISKRNVPIVLAQQNFEGVEKLIRSKARLIGTELYNVPKYPVDQYLSDPPQPFSLPKFFEDDLTAEKQKIPNPLSSTHNATYQHQNASTAVSVAHILRSHPHPLSLIPSLSKNITDESILKGLQGPTMRGRMEWVTLKTVKRETIPVLIDGAHNSEGGKALGSYLHKISKPITMIISMSSPRDPSEFIRSLNIKKLQRMNKLKIIITEFSTEDDHYPKEMGGLISETKRPVSSQEILKSFKDYFEDIDQDLQGENSIERIPNLIIAKDVREALETCERRYEEVGKNNCIVVCGSLYLVRDLIIELDKEQG
ncbi:folylpolyglutamate synthase [Phakopsora pachyrhizi]|nr:folylpolyglutamate synthase [Phakopsora pachyrhizi]